MIFQHNVYFRRSARAGAAVARHLRTVKAALLNEHYLDNEVRFEQLTAHSPRATLVRVELRDPARHDRAPTDGIERERRPRPVPTTAAAASFLPYAAMGRPAARPPRAVPRRVGPMRSGRPGGVRHGPRRRGDLHAGLPRRARAAGPPVWVVDAFRSSPEPDRAPTFTRRWGRGFRPT